MARADFNKISEIPQHLTVVALGLKAIWDQLYDIHLITNILWCPRP